MGCPELLLFMRFTRCTSLHLLDVRSHFYSATFTRALDKHRWMNAPPRAGGPSRRDAGEGSRRVPADPGEGPGCAYEESEATLVGTLVLEQLLPMDPPPPPPPYQGRTPEQKEMQKEKQEVKQEEKQEEKQEVEEKEEGEEKIAEDQGGQGVVQTSDPLFEFMACVSGLEEPSPARDIAPRVWRNVFPASPPPQPRRRTQPPPGQRERGPSREDAERTRPQRHRGDGPAADTTCPGLEHSPEILRGSLHSAPPEAHKMQQQQQPQQQRHHKQGKQQQKQQEKHHQKHGRLHEQQQQKLEKQKQQEQQKKKQQLQEKQQKQKHEHLHSPELHKHEQQQLEQQRLEHEQQQQKDEQQQKSEQQQQKDEQQLKQKQQQLEHEQQQKSEQQQQKDEQQQLKQKQQQLEHEQQQKSEQLQKQDRGNRPPEPSAGYRMVEASRRARWGATGMGAATCPL
ncbi:putative mediator of RNA polymerase II transcription subunit 26 isoform X3 [Lethenteron reissneri]|uniref:putative mediator of RNA polymerase II transcription subunit 26 isoform X3 n=1 Tax=Lethenteron reissneri TaxID=7753 RepID=UPI002AB68993|nr:putative mediator of RNA polymerase II transcription subunit 26 isoform X3 [Lethenteron reissneri]